MKNPRNENTETLLTEEKRLFNLLESLAGIKFMKGSRARASKTLACVQRELTSRGA